MSMAPLVWTPQRILNLAAEAFGVSENDLLGYSRHQPLMSYRWVTMAAVKRFGNLSNTGTASAFHRDYKTVVHSLRMVESDPELSALYGRLAERLLVEGVS